MRRALIAPLGSAPYLQGRNFTVVAAAITTPNGMYFGMKLQVFNRGKQSVNMLPESVTVEDSVGIKQPELFSAAEIADHRRQRHGDGICSVSYTDRARNSEGGGAQLRGVRFGAATLRNREIGDGSGSQLLQRSSRPEQVE